MNLLEDKSFFVDQIINETILQNKKLQKSFVYILKINLPEKTKMLGNKIHFQYFILKLIKNAENAYENNLNNKIILISCKMENNDIFSISVTHGGKKRNLPILKDNLSSFYSPLKIIKKKIYCRTVKYYFSTNK